MDCSSCACRSPPGAEIPDYRLRITFLSDQIAEIDDPYRYGQVLTDFDLHLFGEGNLFRAFERFGSHRIVIGSTTGVHFAVWAPNAQRVSVVGDFNGWDGRTHPMRQLVPSGAWELFVPELQDDLRYKFEIRTPEGALLKKTDPFAVAFETPPLTASVDSRHQRLRVAGPRMDDDAKRPSRMAR